MNPEQLPKLKVEPRKLTPNNFPKTNPELPRTSPELPLRTAPDSLRTPPMKTEKLRDKLNQKNNNGLMTDPPILVEIWVPDLSSLGAVVVPPR